MRLLHTTKLTFSFFFEQNRPSYQILSHTWGEDEPSFLEFDAKFRSDQARSLVVPSLGIQKILSFCKFAALNGCDWVWVDTCCINKESSAELSEAINSMFKWYQGAERCIIYLSDVNLFDADNSIGNQLSRSRWFTRGWTLQELLAPTEATFLDCNWVTVGSKETLSSLLADITGIKESILCSTAPRELVLAEPIATRMSWASRRVTTRPEDIAYCLFGIFNVNMSLLYGEGNNAFLRLQRKLAKRSVDESLFAWTRYLCSEQDDYCGLFAPHPAAFQDVEWIRPSVASCRPIVQNSRGMEVPVYNKFLDEVRPGQELVFPLNCVDQVSRLVGIKLVKVRGRWYRRAQSDLTTLTNRSTIMTIFEKHEPLQGTVYLETTAEKPDRKIKRRKKSSVVDDLPQQSFLRFNNQIPEPLSLLISIDKFQVGTLTPPLKFVHSEVLAAERYLQGLQTPYRDEVLQAEETEPMLDPLLLRVLKHMGQRTTLKHADTSLVFLTHPARQETIVERSEVTEDEDCSVGHKSSILCMPQVVRTLVSHLCI